MKFQHIIVDFLISLTVDCATAFEIDVVKHWVPLFLPEFLPLLQDNFTEKYGKKTHEDWSTLGRDAWFYIPAWLLVVIGAWSLGVWVLTRTSAHNVLHHFLCYL